MKVGTNIQTSHEITLDESEVFEVTTKTARPMTIRVDRVVAAQHEIGGAWDVRATGKRILKSGGLGSNEKLDTWTYRNRFTRDVMTELFTEFSQEVQETLHTLGVTV